LVIALAVLRLLLLVSKVSFVPFFKSVAFRPLLPRTNGAGFTLLELLITILIIAILIVTVIVAFPKIQAKAEAVRCGNNMRQLQVALAAATQDQGHWPQEPANDNQNAWEDWWIQELQTYGPTLGTWQCPSIKRKIAGRNKDGRPKIHYTPTSFDDLPGTPYKWSKQPWLIEIGNMHGGGALIAFPDGSIRTMDDVLKTN
jgi:prepilin-type N-terminal cleavage/methylation domain-containing protein